MAIIFIVRIIIITLVNDSLGQLWVAKKKSKRFPCQNMDKDNLNILQYESLPFPFISIPHWTYAAANALLKQLLIFQH